MTTAPSAADHATLDLEHFLPYRLSVLSNRISSAIAREYSTRFGLAVTEWRFVLWDGPGRARVVAGVDPAAVRAVLAQ